MEFGAQDSDTIHAMVQCWHTLALQLSTMMKVFLPPLGRPVGLAVKSEEGEGRWGKGEGGGR